MNTLLIKCLNKLTNKMLFGTTTYSFVFMMGCTPPAEIPDISAYPDSWTHQALSLQRQLDHEEPLSRTTFLATHNSYSAQYYGSFDPNQIHSVPDQLTMDMRALEFDIHSFNDRIILCHGLNDHVGCVNANRDLEEGLQDVVNWLNQPNNGNEVIILYLEEHLDEAAHFAQAVSIIDNTIGALVYRPQGAGCQGIPLAISKADVIAAGKQILLMSDGCPETQYSTWVHGGVGSSLGGYPTGDVANLMDYPTCDIAEFDRNDFNSLLIRYYEDRTELSAGFGNPGDPITPLNIPYLLNCEANIIGLDKITANDGRLEAAVWSWANDEPANVTGDEDCASHNAAGRIVASDCVELKSFACRQVDGTWIVQAAPGVFADGQSACDTAGAIFSTPFSGYDNELLKQAKLLAGASQVWLNYSDAATEGEWIKM